ncbi:MAG: leucine--tRNA ligase [Pyrinomonadaceae bacterium]
MDEKYFAKKIEQKWQQKWAEAKAFEASMESGKPKFYALEMLPYPSGNLHMGHVRNYSAGDVVAWYKRLKGFNVLHPIGWDSFGQPAEDAAIKRGANPREWTEENIKAMQGQLQRLGISYDWSRQMAAHRPEYYKFDQWFFLKMYEMGLAYKKKTQVNWCETDQATLSNEQASGGLCWRCGNPVTKKDLEQWFLKTTAYSDQLLDDMAEIEAGWPSNVIKRQRDWIGRSEGAFVDFEVRATLGVKLGDRGSTTPSAEAASTPPQTGGEQRTTPSVGAASTPPQTGGVVGRPADAGTPNGNHIRVFTTRIDTIYGANAVVVAAEHPVIVEHLSQFSDDVHAKIQQIRAEKMNPTDHETEAIKDGIDTGLKAINPFSGEELPVWIGNYVMMEYGTGAVMSVPAHDERDFEFAKKFGLPIRSVIEPERRGDAEGGRGDEGGTAATRTAADEPFTDYGVMVNSGDWTGRTSEEGKREMTAFAAEKGFGEAATTYRLRDWGVSRQRFWGSPIPIVYCDACGTVPEKYENLPVELPETAPFTGTGESPLAKVPEFVNTTCPSCGGAARRETDTMDTFVDSSWYYYRYIDPQNGELPVAAERANYWTPVDQYIGGDDHAVMHLIYARFWTKVMRDLGMVGFDEPFRRLLTQGMVIGETFFDESSGKRKYWMPDDVIVERDAKGKIVSAKGTDGTVLKHSIERMSKSKGNGVDPDEMIDIYGADAARIFVMFAAPIENELVWNEAGIEGAVRFLQRVWRHVYKWKASMSATAGGTTPSAQSGGHPSFSKEGSEAARQLRRKTHQTIRRVEESLETLQFNTPVAALMELSNAIGDFQAEPASASKEEVFAVREAIESLALMLTPFAPHTAEELYAVVAGNENGIVVNDARFPVFRPDLAKEDEIEIPVQVNGKLRAKLLIPPDTNDDDLREAAKADQKVREYTDGKEIVKIVVVPKRLVSIVVK